MGGCEHFVHLGNGRNELNYVLLCYVMMNKQAVNHQLYMNICIYLFLSFSLGELLYLSFCMAFVFACERLLGRK